MIKIIKSGKKEFRTTCPCCGCEFTYEIEDLNGKDYDGQGYINCPECNALISHLMRSPKPTEIFYNDTVKNNMQFSNPCANCDYTKKLMSGQVYVGDSPCTWCQHNLFKITCNSINTNIGTTASPSKIDDVGIDNYDGEN